MKRVFAIIIMLAIAVSCFSLSSFADETTEVQDGFDYYSLTVHYTENVVVGYKYVTSADNIVVKDKEGNVVKDADGNDTILKKGYIFADAQDSYVVPAIEYALTVDDTTKTSQTIKYGDSVLKSKKYNQLFYSINASDFGMDSSKIAINSNYGLTNISNNTAITVKNAVGLYGPQEFYDDAGNPNPNFERDENGFFLDESVDAEGNHNKIDINGYTIDANGIWHSKDGHRVEPFVEINGSLIWISPAERMVDGVVIDYHTITNAVLMERGIITTVPDTYADATDEFDESKDYDGDGKTGTSKDRKAWNTVCKAKKTWLGNCDLVLYTIDYQDYVGVDKKGNVTDTPDGKKTQEDLVKYNDVTTVFTENEIMHQKDKSGEEKKDANGKPMLVYGSPAIGSPVSKVQIKSLTVEIDAIGSQTYTDVAADPQQKNTIVVTSGDLYQNIKVAQEYVAANPNKEYTDGVVLGTAKCVTTKTAVAAEQGYPSTLKSVEVVMEEGVVIPANATLYLNFFVETSQAENTKTYIAKKDYNLLAINKQKINVELIPDKAVEEEEPTEKKGCFGAIGGSMAILSIIGLAYVSLRKKEN